ncbi:MAG: M20/M25/M40 family metallo-hydrolase [Candidatus Koribacter versatilis]|uniref:M20/M25/M40 family metallo-hydrolase n=1 Tax=Candidatus Korobacter versatilis TaxID=658062 RepID=A0A932A9L8_9BACT|nr:M20/M25/M40 family metallo-hydrolase [Candidatus Koribacter versatilis]
MRIRLAVGLAVGMALPAMMVAQKPAGKNAASGPLDAHIVSALKDVSPARVKASIEKLASFGTRNTLSSNDPEMPKQGRGVVAAREWLKSEYERYGAACGGCLEVQYDQFTQAPGRRVPQPTDLANVYAIQRGTDPEGAKHIYLVTGHHDSMPTSPTDPKSNAPGANDDASGTAVSLECARVLSKHKFPQTIIYLTVAGEEQGLLGSAHFAQMAKEKGWQIDGVLNNDIVGGVKTPGQDASIVRVFSEGVPVAASEEQIRMLRNIGGESDSASRQLARYVRETAKKYMSKGDFGPKLVFRRDRYLRGGDHTSFNEQGFAAVRFTEYREDYTHQHQDVRTENGIEYGDLPKFVDFDYVANVARLNAATLASLASAPAPPVNVTLVTEKLENDTTITWDPSPDGRATGYEVVWRPTTAAEWENVETVGDVHIAVLKRSKDNVFFGVRAVDKQGHRSLPVIPMPKMRQAAAPAAPSAPQEKK